MLECLTFSEFLWLNSYEICYLRLPISFEFGDVGTHVHTLTFMQLVTFIHASFLCISYLYTLNLLIRFVVMMIINLVMMCVCVCALTHHTHKDEHGTDNQIWILWKDCIYDPWLSLIMIDSAFKNVNLPRFSKYMTLSQNINIGECGRIQHTIIRAVSVVSFWLNHLKPTRKVKTYTSIAMLLL